MRLLHDKVRVDRGQVHVHSVFEIPTTEGLHVMADVLRAAGWTVVAPGRYGEWETPAQFCCRIGIHPQTFIRRVKGGNLPPVEFDRGASGRINRLASTPEFDQFCKPRFTRHAATAAS